MNADQDDEVKVFRKVEVDDVPSTDFTAEKAKLALESDLEVEGGIQIPSIFGDSINNDPAAIKLKSEPQPGPFLHLLQHQFNPMLSPFFPMLPNISPLYQSPSFPFMSPGFLPFGTGYNPIAQAQMKLFQGNIFPMTNSFSNLNMNSIIPQITPQTASSPKQESVQKLDKKDKNRIKKPCNAFMIYMRENRESLRNANELKQSSEINRELGQRWQQMSKEEQEKYFEMARNEREEHAKLYPGWSARDNYAIHKKNKKMRKERSYDHISDNEQKKCRARFGIENMDKWCKHCRRKKRCLNVQDDNTCPTTPTYINQITPL